MPPRSLVALVLAAVPLLGLASLQVEADAATAAAAFAWTSRSQNPRYRRGGASIGGRPPPTTMPFLGAGCSLVAGGIGVARPAATAISAEDADAETLKLIQRCPCVVQRLDLTDRFLRWRFLQRLLEAEVDATDANELLYRVLKSFLDFPRPDRIEDETYPGGMRDNPSPKVTDESRSVMERIFRVDDETGAGIVPALREPDCAPFDGDVLEGLGRLLPDPIEEEDAHRSGWDLVMELVGREAVKMNEQRGTDGDDGGWRARCDVARLLIHYDFLSDGVVQEPFE